jgi:hypothetical protein
LVGGGHLRKERCYSIGNYLSNDIIRDIAKRNWPEIIKEGGVILLRDQCQKG